MSGYFKNAETQKGEMKRNEQKMLTMIFEFSQLLTFKREINI